MVSASEGLLIAQFTRDVLGGAIRAIEEMDGEVVGFMGDAILGLVRTAESTVFACCGIAKNLNKQCEYISSQQNESSEL